MIRDGDLLPRVELPLTLRRMIVSVGSGWDFFPGHHDPTYARSHGHPTIFANTGLFLALADRVIADWGGPRTRILRRKLTMVRPAYLGDVLSGEGVVVGRDPAGSSVDVRLELGTIDGPCAHAEATVELPD